MKKLIGLAVFLLVILGAATIKLNRSHVKAEVNNQGAVEDFTFETNVKETSGARVAQKVEPLSQEEYDDLINSLPAGASLVDDVEVMPGVVK